MVLTPFVRRGSSLRVVALRRGPPDLAHDPLEIRFGLCARLVVFRRLACDEADLIHHLVDQRAEAGAQPPVAVGLF